MASTDKPIILITGGNTGIGLAIVKALCQSPIAYHILLGCRTVQKGEDAIKTIKTEVPNTTSTTSTIQIDVTSDDSIQKAAEYVSTTYSRLDTLINNAGASFDGDYHQGKATMREVWNKAWDVNVSGAQVMTELFLPLLFKSRDPRIIFLTSGTASLTETESTAANPMLERINAAPAAGWPKEAKDVRYPAYRSCKVGLNMMMREWCRILRNDGVKVWSIAPGFLATGLGGVGPEFLKKAGAGDPSKGGEFIRDVVQGMRDGDEGKAIRADMVQAW